MKAFSLCVLLLALSAVADSQDYPSLCRLFKTNTVIAMPGECDKYIKCQGSSRGEVFTCSSPTGYDVKTQACKDKYDTSDLCGNPCSGKNGLWVPDPKSCNGYHYCKSGEAHVGYCDGSMFFDDKQQMCVHNPSSPCVGAASICSLVPDKTKFRNENNCQAYYECSSKKLSSKTCTSKNYFDVEKQACVEKKLVECNAHPVPSGTCISLKKPFKGFKPDGATCRGFFHCADLGIVEDLEPTWGQCPEGTFFDGVTQSCITPRDVKCAFNRCEGRGTTMVSSGSNNCHNYIICEDGYEVQERTCSYDYFFDEVYQACVPDIIYYTCCDIK